VVKELVVEVERYVVAVVVSNEEARAMSNERLSVCGKMRLMEEVMATEEKSNVTAMMR